VRVYAQKIGLDPEQVVREFSELHPDPVAAASALEALAQNSQGKRPKTRIGLMIAGLAGLRPQRREVQHHVVTPETFAMEERRPRRSGRPGGTPSRRSGRPGGTPSRRSGRPGGTPSRRSGRPEGTPSRRSGRPEGTPSRRSGRPEGTPSRRSGRPGRAAPVSPRAHRRNPHARGARSWRSR
jgi:hypothetical protein